MDRNVGAKIIHNARYKASGLIPPHADADTFADEAWQTLSEEVKEEYRMAADATLSKFLEESEGRVIKIVDGQILQVMDKKEFDFITKQLAKYTQYWNAEREYFPKLVSSAIGNLEHKEQKQIQRLKHIQDDLLTYLRALALIATSVGNASTHSEKNARLRGMIDLIESAIQSVRRGYDDLLTREWSNNPDLFRSDYPVRAYIEKIQKLESEIKLLKNGDSGEEPDPDDIPM